MKQKAEVVGKADNNKKQTSEEQTKNKNMILYKDGNIENTKWEEESKREDKQYGKPSQRCQKHQEVTADETKTKE